ncbi:hypothetical protein [Aurantivibrio infirmus]
MKTTKGLHIFLYVVERVDDPFHGLINRLDQFESEKVVVIRLAKKEYDVINRIEYSIRKYVRIFYYKNIFSKIEYEIEKAVLENQSYENINIYLSDEGIWAEVIRKIQSSLAKKGILLKTINVQHGFFVLGRWLSEKNIGIAARKFVNTISRSLFGHPNLGMAFGRGGLDTYLVYGEKEKRFLESEGVEDIYVCPSLIKNGFIERFRLFEARNTLGTKHMLFVMPHFVPGTGMKCNLKHLLDYLSPIFRSINERFGYTVLIRFHPGADRGSWEGEYLESPVSNYAKIDESKDIAESMSKSDYVLGLHSTALFEAGIVGKVPISLQTPFVDAVLAFKYEPLFTNKPIEEELSRLINDTVREKYKIESKEDSDCSGVINSLVGSAKV